ARLLSIMEEQCRLPRLQIDIGVVPFPDDVLAGAPRPDHFLLELLLESPDLDVVPRPVEPIQLILASLLDLQAELRLEAVARFITDQCQVSPGLGYLNLDRRHGFIALRRRTAISFAAQETVRKRGREIIGPERLRLPAGTLDVELLRFTENGGVRNRLHRLIGLAERRSGFGEVGLLYLGEAGEHAQ